MYLLVFNIIVTLPDKFPSGLLRYTYIEFLLDVLEPGD